MNSLPSGRHDSRAWLGLLLLLATPSLIWGCWGAPFLTYDDPIFVAENPLLQPQIPWRRIWLPHHEVHYFYYPLTLFSWRIDRVLWEGLLQGWLGPNAWPAGVRTTNLLLHLLTSFWVWKIVRRLGAGPLLSAFVTAAFALHPTVCETVDWASERKSALSACLGMGAVWFYISATHWRRLAGATTLYAAALLSKPSVLGLFGVLFLWEALGRPSLSCPSHLSFTTENTERTENGEKTWSVKDLLCSVLSGLCALCGKNGPPNEEAPPGGRSWKGAALRLAPFFALSLAGGLVAVYCHTGLLQAPPGGSIWTALLTDVVVLWRYSLNFLWPAHLSCFYGIAPETSLLDGRLWASAAGLLILVAGTIRLAPRPARLLAAFGWLWMVAAMGTNLNLVSITVLMQDRYAYLSAPGFWLAIGLALQGLGERLPELRRILPRPLPAVGLALVSLAWAGLSYERGALFAETRPLFEDAAHQEPQSSYARIFLAGDLSVAAEAARRKGEAGEAQKLFDRCLSELEAGVAAPDFHRYLHQAHAHVDLGRMYLRRGRLEEAKREALAALYPPKGVRLYNADAAAAEEILGRVELEHRQPKEALAHLDGSLQWVFGQSEIQFHRARALVMLQDLSEQTGDLEGARRLYHLAMEALGEVKPADESYALAQEYLRHIQPPGGKP